jgi:membrane protease YdiL (CAAX protease family)
VWTLYAALAGLLFGALLLWRGSLLAPAAAHVLVNAVNLRRLAATGPARAF